RERFLEVGLGRRVAESEKAFARRTEVDARGGSDTCAVQEVEREATRIGVKRAGVREHVEGALGNRGDPESKLPQAADKQGAPSRIRLAHARNGRRPVLERCDSGVLHE